MTACAWCGGPVVEGLLAELPACGLGCAVEAGLIPVGLVVTVEGHRGRYVVRGCRERGRVTWLLVDPFDSSASRAWKGGGILPPWDVIEALGWAPEEEVASG